jgi:hypothetical protein
MEMSSTQAHPEAVHPNPWNYRRQDERERRAARESIATYGFIDPITVRPHPDLSGQWQIIDGEHRWMAARPTSVDLGALTVLDPCPDVIVKKLTKVERNHTAPTVSSWDRPGRALQAEGDDLTNAPCRSPRWTWRASCWPRSAPHGRAAAVRA